MAKDFDLDGLLQPVGPEEAISFEELGVVDPEWESLEAKLRSGITKHTLGAEALKASELVVECGRG